MIDGGTSSFQSLIGRIKTKKVDSFRRGMRSFQSLIGRLKTPHVSALAEKGMVGFNPL